MAEVRVRYLTKRERRGQIQYYWQPSAELRGFGWKLKRLPDDPSEAIREAEKINADLDNWRKKGCLSGPREGSVADLIKRYCADDAYRSLAAKSRSNYHRYLSEIAGFWGDLAVSSITRRAVLAYRDRYQDRPYMGNAALRVLRVLLEYARDLELIETNPATRPRMFSVRPRDQVWTHEQERLFVETAHECGLPSLALAMALGVYTAQRQGDIITMPWSAYDGSWLRRRRQRKTGKLLDVPVLSPLRAALEATQRRSPLILTTETGVAYQSGYFRELWRRVTLAAGLDGLQFRDLRRTATVRMGEAGISTPLIASVTGHDIEHTAQILETYLPRNREMAARAAAEMENYYARLGK